MSCKEAPHGLESPVKRLKMQKAVLENLSFREKEVRNTDSCYFSMQVAHTELLFEAHQRRFETLRPARGVGYAGGLFRRLKN